jgi:hypothetical protein
MTVGPVRTWLRDDDRQLDASLKPRRARQRNSPYRALRLGLDDGPPRAEQPDDEENDRVPTTPSNHAISRITAKAYSRNARRHE